MVTTANQEAFLRAEKKSSVSATPRGLRFFSVDISIDKNIVICGGGIIGCSVAYYLSELGFKSTVIDKSGIALGASGKAGGFLSRDMPAVPEPKLEDFSQKSFDLHERLAFLTSHYRKIDALSVAMSGLPSALKVKQTAEETTTSLPSWVTAPILGPPQLIGTTEDSAQVHPYHLSHGFLHAAKHATFQKGSVEGIVAEESVIKGVIVDGVTFPADIVVVALGPWCSLAEKWLNIRIPTKICKSESVLFTPRDASNISATALFVDYVHTDGIEGKWTSPEVYPRPDGTCFIGMAEDIMEQVPSGPEEVIPDPSITKSIENFAVILSADLEDWTQSLPQACLFPVSSDGIPLVGAVKNLQGAFLATGHGYWGISHAPITGKMIAELISEGHVSCITNPQDFDPNRFSDV